MNFLKRIVKYIKPFQMPEGDYLAKVTDVSIVHKGNKCPQIVLFYVMQNIETGDFVAHKETMIGDFGLLRCRDLMFFLECNAIDYFNFTDLIGAVFEVTVGYDLVCGKMLPTLLYQEVVTPPPSALLSEGGCAL